MYRRILGITFRPWIKNFLIYSGLSPFFKESYIGIHWTSTILLFGLMNLFGICWTFVSLLFELMNLPLNSILD